MSATQGDSYSDGNRGLSPVIGVILMVAIVVVLAAVISVFTLQLGDQSSTSSAGVDVGATDDSYTITVIDMGTSESIYITCDGTRLEDSEITTVGTHHIEEPCSEISIIGTNDGDETTISTVNTSTISGGPETPIAHSVAPTETDEYDTLADVQSGMAGSGSCSGDPYQISNDYELQAMNADRDACYVLANDIDASGTNEWASGFNPIGPTYTEVFSGELDGNGYEIKGLSVPDNTYSGLFGYIRGGVVTNVGVVDVDVTGETSGGIAGHARNGDRDGEIRNSYATGSVTSDSRGGGLVGESSVGISQSYSDVDVTGHNDVGGVYVGGIAGSQTLDAITDSYATGDVSVPADSDNKIGGLIGETNGSVEVSASYVAGDVEVRGGDAPAGGLVGGARGTNTGPTITDTVYWDTEATGMDESVGDPNGYTTDNSTGLSTDEMQGSTRDSDFETAFSSPEWTLPDADMYPHLSWE